MPAYEPGDYIKAEFRNDRTGESEWMWASVGRADDPARTVFGRLDNEPLVNTDLPLGQGIAVDVIREHAKASAFDQ